MRLTDESGKINLNQATEDMLYNLVTTMGFEGQAARALVDAILDWRDQDNISRPQGAESDYYQSLNPPYLAKNGPLDTVEELFWVRGFDPATLGQLREFFTVQKTGRVVNVNPAPLEVLRAFAMTAEQAQAIIQARVLTPLRNLRELNNALGASAMGRFSAPMRPSHRNDHGFLCGPAALFPRR